MRRTFSYHPALVLLLVVLFSATCHAQYQTVQISSPNATDPEEVTISINPANPAVMLAGANLTYWYRTTDAGLTWNEYEFQTGTWGDPSVHFGPDGTAYFANLHYSWEAIICRRSTNQGATWRPYVKLYGPSSAKAVPGAGNLLNSSLQDKEWLIADHSSSPYRGYVYATWTDFTKYYSEEPSDSTVIVFARSIDTGATFESYVRISDKAGIAVDSDSAMEGAVPAVGPNGEIYVAWAGPDGIYFDRSFDGGVTWGEDRIIASQPGGWDFEIKGISRCNGLPITLADISNSPSRGTVYVNWVDSRNGDHDVFIIKSTDRGTTWSEPIRVNDDPAGNGKDQFFTWAAVDKITGELCVVFYDRRKYNTDSTDVYLARSNDGGLTYLNECLTARPFYPAPFVFFGDYICVDAHNGIIRPIWTEMHNMNLSVHTAIIGMPTSASEAASLPSAFGLQSIYPNPVSSRTATELFIRVVLPERSLVSAVFYDMLGREVFRNLVASYETGSQTMAVRGTFPAAGMYLCKVTASPDGSPHSGGKTIVRQIMCSH